MGTDGFRITGRFETGGEVETISCKWKASKKEVFRNEVPYDKFTDHIGRFSAVMIAPDDTELITGVGELRRKWMDSILGQTDRDYLERILHYQRILQQRNAWLKMQYLKPTGDFTPLEYYDAQLAACGNYIFLKRNEFIQEFAPLLADIYQQISGGKEVVNIQYETDLFQKPLQDWLKDGLEHDLRLQRTLRGIHKDDWVFGVGELLLKQYGSQGQKKSFLFALKLAQYNYLTKKSGKLPILLLDDIFEKLDQSRMEALLRIIRQPGFGQVILTDTHSERIRQAFGPDAPIGFIHL
jgi:DNA replication and repair protein RecF